MTEPKMRLTYIGGPTVLIEMGGLYLLTDPTFDPAGKEYRTDAYTLHKTGEPALGPDSIGKLDVILLSHDHHFDNLDDAGRRILGHASHILTTIDGAKRLGGKSVGLVPWQRIELTTNDGRILQVTATPARHGPANMDRGPVIGFVLQLDDAPEQAVYISGDTVWYDELLEVAKRFEIKVAILFMGAAKVSEVGPWNLTLTASEGVIAAQAFSDAIIIPVHFEGWAHFSESRIDIDKAFADANIGHRLRWFEPGRPTNL